MATNITADNVDDREPVRELAKELTGALYGASKVISVKRSRTI
ncbi:hypothetical protein [Xenorhabdus hominickii]